MSNASIRNQHEDAIRWRERRNQVLRESIADMEVEIEENESAIEDAKDRLLRMEES